MMQETDLHEPISLRPDLPDWGIYPRWPEAGELWIHPDDRATALTLIPSERVFQRVQWDGEHYHLFYGKTLIRVKPTMWLRIPDIDLEIDDQVELLSQFGKNDPGIYRISDIQHCVEQHQTRFQLYRDEVRLPDWFVRDDLRLLSIKASLREGFFSGDSTPRPQTQLPSDIELLNVGNLLEDSEEN